jgi:hypothetical protein
MHMLPSGPEKPALQVQLVKAALPAGELDFDGQELHVEFAEGPTAAEYFPSPHCVHVEDPLIFWYEPDEHKVHVLRAVAPVVFENFPDAHDKHDADPLTFMYFPATQFVHDALPDSCLYVPTPHATQARGPLRLKLW